MANLTDGTPFNPFGADQQPANGSGRSATIIAAFFVLIVIAFFVVVHYWR